MNSTPSPAPVTVRTAELARIVGISDKTLIHWAKTRPDFPKPFNLDSRLGHKRWVLADVMAALRGGKEAS